MHKKLILPIGALAIAAFVLSPTLNAAVVVEPFGFNSGNFSVSGGTGVANPSSTSSAPGASGAGSTAAYNNPSTQGSFVFSFTPGTTGDNFLPEFGLDLGLGNEATGYRQSDLADGGSGLYNVFFTMPTHANATSGGAQTLTITQDGANVVFVNSNPNDEAMENTWTLVGQVNLTLGQTYTVTTTAGAGFVGQRAGGVMWEVAEIAPVPEPSTIALGLIGGAGLALGYIRRRK